MKDQRDVGLTDIALVGMSGRFPGAKNLDEFWQNLVEGVNSIRFFSDAELEAANIDSELLKNPLYVKAGAVLENIELFDALFFGYTRREAEIMDPQHRLFLECAWEAIEHAGYDCETYEGRIGVYSGASLNRYLLNVYSHPEIVNSTSDLQIIIGNKTDHVATRVSYKLNLRGPSLNIQCGCSTSLVAVSVACQSLLGYQCDMALVGAASIRLLQKRGYLYDEGGILSPDGYCRAFDANAGGTVGGDGVGVVVLKRLSDARADGDYIHAVIKGSAINNDGSFKVGYTAPREEGQYEVITEALAMAHVEPETVGYVETHGTGTIVGDPIEFTALAKAFRTATVERNFCAIGSVKTNIGHLDAAAGMAGLIKTTLALKHKKLPPSLHFEQPNPSIDFANSPFYVNTRLSEWKTVGVPRRAGVSSFGIGGTNAHIILEEWSQTSSTAASRPQELLILSAKTESALEAMRANLLTHLQEHPEDDLASVAYTLQVGRKAFSQRRVVMCRSRSDAMEALAGSHGTRVWSSFQERRERSVVMMFSGQGTQYPGMARELYQREQVFREQVDVCAELLKPQLKLDLRDMLYPESDEKLDVALEIDQTIAQPILFVIEYALAHLWMEWGVHPEAMIGESTGEYVAACLAGVMSLEDALFLVAGRGEFSKVKLNPSRLPFISNLTGTWITPDQATSPDYWAKQPRQTVRFADGIVELLKGPERLFLEVGPGGTLITQIKEMMHDTSVTVALSSLGHHNEESSDLEVMLQTLSQLWLAGVKIDWAGFHAHEERRRIPLPTYPFERERYWLDAQPLVANYQTEAPVATPDVNDPDSDPLLSMTVRSDESPNNQNEQTIQLIWQEVLGIEPIGLHDNFFELGGDSLVAIQLMSRLRTALALELPMTSLFESPTIAGLAAVVSEHQLQNPDEEELESMLAEIERLSPEEIDANLASVLGLDVEEKSAMRSMKFSLFFFSDDGSKDKPEKYRLLLESAKFADTHGLSAVWTPERHFQDFGGLYPNPSVLGAALAMITERIQLRAGSVALPLHNPIRVAEEWSVVDNLSNGRVAVSFASGWHPLDFVLSPASYQDRKELVFQNARVIQDLWAGESLAATGVDGLEVKVRILPKPIQPRLPTWLTIQSKPESWVKAGEMGANVLTSIVSQPLDILAEKIRLYRESLAEHGYDPAAGQVAVMLHTFLGEDNETVKKQIRTPLMHYLRSNLKQLGPQPEVYSMPFKYENLTEADLDVVASHAFERYFDTILLCGTVAKCSRLVDKLSEIGVDEIACFIDFGLPLDAVMDGLHHLSILNKKYQKMDASKAITVPSHG